MTRILLSTSNIMSGGPSVIRRTPFTKSNTEFTTALRSNFKEAWTTLAEEAAEAAEAAAAAATTATPKGEEAGPNGLSPGAEISRPSNYRLWTSLDEATDTVLVPSPDLVGSGTGLRDEQSAYDVTVKLFFLPTTDLSRHRAHVQEAVGQVLRELSVSSIDLLIMSFPEVTFDADDDMESEEEEVEEGGNDDHDARAGGGGTNSGDANGESIQQEPPLPDTAEEREQLACQVRTWRSLEDLHAAGTVRQLGVAEFGSERLRRFLAAIRVRPGLDQINVRDCCVVPRSLILFGRRERIELITHNDSTDILPKGTIRDLLGDGPRGAGVLGPATPALCGEVEPQWVAKYTAVVKDRGVVENKGYFAMADLVQA